MSSGDYTQFESCAEKALARLRDEGLPPIPENFSLFYNYFMGSNPNLNISLDLMAAQFGKLGQTQCSELYQAHLGLEAEHRVLETAANSIEDEIKRVMTTLNKSSTDAKQYDKTLSSFSGALQEAPSLDQIKLAVAKVASETRVMVEQNQRLHTQLVQSTQQLTEARFSLDLVRKDSLLDPLTEVGNRKFFSNELARTIAEARENKMPLALLMADIDHFKKFNDTYGHLIGDEVLRLVAKTLIENLKGRDVIARYGGEEFVILLPNTTVADAEKVGNQLRTALGTKQVRRKRTNETLGIVTVSLGGTSYLEGEDPETFIARADAALFEAKQTGRNKVAVREPDQSSDMPTAPAGA